MHRYVVSLALLCFALWHFRYLNLADLHSNLITKPDGTNETWTWEKIDPSRDLEWHDCFKEYQCARLDLPLDWLEPLNDARITIAVIKLPAKDTNNYKGPIFTNPGVHSLKSNGNYLQKIAGENHDIISFDPRGIGASTPRIECWLSNQDRSLWAQQNTEVVDSHSGVLNDAYARSTAFSQLCSSTFETGSNNNPSATSSNFTGSFLEYVSTTSVARDMLEIMNKTGSVKLKYWGFSYGTYLGGVFAAMYPDKIDRLVSDGNVDYREWSTNTHKNFLHDTDRVMDAFYHFCHLAGPDRCAFFSTSPEAIEYRLNRLLANLKSHPIVVPAPAQKPGLPVLASYSSLERLISTALYQPVRIFPSLARILHAIEGGDGRPLVGFLSEMGLQTQFSCECESCNDPHGRNDKPGTDDAFAAIMCSDGGLMTDTVEDFEDYAAFLMKQSKAAGAVNVLFRISCAGWRAKAKWRFQGPFEGNTSFPILYISNQADNVTPLRSARNNAAGFHDSVILTQESFGHTSLSAPSTCTASHVREYFQRGVLPKAGTQCKPDIDPFQDKPKDDTLSVDRDVELESALWELATTMLWFPGLSH